MNTKRQMVAHRRALFGMLGLLVPACAANPGDDDVPGGTSFREACRDAVFVRDEAGNKTGFEKCADGRVHRARAVACADPWPEGHACPFGGFECKVDADCKEHPYGRCFDLSDQQEYCGCVYGCVTDADCADGNVCVCAGAGVDLPGRAQCVPSTCKSDQACPDGEACIIGQYYLCDWEFGLACTSAADTCHSLADCDGDLSGLGCSADFTGKFECTGGGACGRPFVVEAQGRVAEPCFGAAWGALEPAPGPLTLSCVEGEALTAHWLSMAALEHASVASFAQFTLGLMAHGAPPALLSATAQAMADEVEHARRCYAIASVYAGMAISPGPLDTSGARPAESLEALLTATIREACVGETLGAVEAAHMAECVAEPALREAWALIAADELRHAALGWQTLSWGLPRAPGLTAGAVRATVLAALAESLGPPSDDLSDDPVVVARLRAHGMLAATERRALFLDAAELLIGPCVEAILGTAGACPAA